LKRLVQAYDEVEKGLPVPDPYPGQYWDVSGTTVAYPQTSTVSTGGYGIAGTAGLVGQKIYYQTANDPLYTQIKYCTCNKATCTC
jgi:hypothetical protein